MLKVRALFKGVELSVIRGDLTEQAVDAIVNAANKNLAHGGGVALAISRKGGPVISQESKEYIKRYGKVKTGSVAFTKGGDLPCQFVIHAVGPVFSGDLSKDSVLLRNAIMSSFKKAEELNLKSIAFPAISSGIFGFPKDKCAENFIQTTKEFIESERRCLEVIKFVNYDELTANVFEQEFRKMFSNEEKIEETKELNEKISCLNLNMLEREKERNIVDKNMKIEEKKIKEELKNRKETREVKGKELNKGLNKGNPLGSTHKVGNSPGPAYSKNNDKSNQNPVFKVEGTGVKPRAATIKFIESQEKNKGNLNISKASPKKSK